MSPWSWPRLLGLLLLLALPAGGLAPQPPVALTAVQTGAWSPPAAEEILRPFDPPAQPWAAGHRGVDWAAPDGRVVAPAAGTVHFAGDVAGRPVITLAHANGMYSSLEPVSATAGLAVGDAVGAGEVLGSAAAVGGAEPGGGHCPQRCVHWGVRIPDGWVVDGSAWDRYLDPLVLLGWSGPSVLWPLEGGPPGG
ncbi:M23 family metallopeptidase [Citricoccus nitrophenolicus]|uniref:M23 family metallopeptidase n=1 Tax=Citricoccus nitrophenolicus TaxID=863575 RepID=UPI0031ECE086